MSARILAFEPNVAKHQNVPPRRPRNAEVRSREYLSPDEVEALIKAAERVGRHGHRNATLILLAYSHGLRVSELIALRWDQVDLKAGRLHLVRLKNGTPSTRPLRGPELRALRKVARAGRLAELPFAIHPHMLKHACGYKLANDGHDTRAIQHYFCHKNITHTVRYTELAADRFNGFWQD